MRIAPENLTVRVATTRRELSLASRGNRLARVALHDQPLSVSFDERLQGGGCHLSRCASRRG